MTMKFTVKERLMENSYAIDVPRNKKDNDAIMDAIVSIKTLHPNWTKITIELEND